MRSREAWLAAMTAVLGVTDAACKKDATDAPAVAREVTSVVQSAAAITSETPTTTSSVASTSPSGFASAVASASASAPKAIGPSGTGTTWQRHAPLSCGAAISQLHTDPGSQSCGVSTRVDVQGPRARIATTVTNAADGDERVVASMRARLRSCANKGLQNDPNETGKVVVTIAVGANGDVTSSSVTSSNGLGGSTVACMAAAFRSATFGAGAPRSLVVTIVQTHEDR